MQRLDGRFIYSASDLNDYLECKRLTQLESLVAHGLSARPHVEDEGRELIQRKGEEHEGRHLDAMRARHGTGVVCFERSDAKVEAYRQADAATKRAMQSGAPVIYQAAFFDETFIGYADFLRRIETPSGLGTWSYEVIDTKLALETKPYYLIQLCNYSEHLMRLQGMMPEFGYIVLGDGEERRFRLNDYLAYYRHSKAGFLTFIAAANAAATPQAGVADQATEYPFECSHCKVCAWDDACTQVRRRDDHLSLVAGMRRDQIVKFEAAAVTTLEALAVATDAQRPDGMPEDTFAKLRRQARLQAQGRRESRYVHEILQPEPASGFALLPAPAPGDLFFDIEGDPLYQPGHGLEYLFGFWMPGEEPAYRAFWARNFAEEKARFEEVVDLIAERRRQYPAMHVYHYAPYETSALKRLKQHHFTREDAVDDLLRSEVFVDLYAVVRQGLALSTDGYGLKNVEKFYPLRRLTETKRGDQSIVMFERWLVERDQALLDDIEKYNRDDCRSTWMLRDWLLQRRQEAIESHGEIAFRPAKDSSDSCHAEFQESCKKCRERRKKEREEERRTEIERQLLAKDDSVARLLAHIVAYHRREEQPDWWEYYHRLDNVDELLEFDREAIAGLRLLADCEPGRKNNSYVYTYTFPGQVHKLEAGNAVDPRTEKSVTILDIDEDRNRLSLKTTMGLEQAGAIRELIPPRPLPTPAQRAALARIGEAYLAGTLASDFPATYDLLLGADPRPRGTLQPAHVSPESVSAAVQRLDRSYLFVQGPPGSGKTTIGARAICDLLAANKRVGVMSTGHKAIHHLLHKVEECVRARGASFRGLYKDSGGDSGYVSPLEPGFIRSVHTNEAFDAGDYELAGGTSWLFSRPEMIARFDYLFIDEAGQVSLADALATSACARNVVLLGDPSQLSQVSKASHPIEAAAASVLGHLLGDAQTVPAHRGIFLDLSHRMQPEICAFVSDAMYERRLKPSPATAAHRIVTTAGDRAGLCFVPVEHSGNSSSSNEEAEVILSEILRFLAAEVVDSLPAGTAGPARPLTSRDAIVVTPYNAQRRKIGQKLKAAGIDVAVGTVDRFQGQEAAVVFYSMATSSGEDVPRNMKFLFAANRFNVAISRARALTVLVCSPRLLDAACSSPEEMALVNLLCAFAERAERFKGEERRVVQA